MNQEYAGVGILAYEPSDGCSLNCGWQGLVYLSMHVLNNTWMKECLESWCCVGQVLWVPSWLSLVRGAYSFVVELTSLAISPSLYVSLVYEWDLVFIPCGFCAQLGGGLSEERLHVVQSAYGWEERFSCIASFVRGSSRK